MYCVWWIDHVRLTNVYQNEEQSPKSPLLFVWSLSSHSRIYHLYGDVIIAGEGLQILTYARHSWPLSSEGSLMCHIYCDIGLLFLMVIFEDPLQLLPRVWQWTCHDLFLRIRSVANGGRTPISRMRGEHFTLRHRGGHNIPCSEINLCLVAKCYWINQYKRIHSLWQKPTVYGKRR